MSPVYSRGGATAGADKYAHTDQYCMCTIEREGGK